jgi:hypothetical protein
MLSYVGGRSTAQGAAERRWLRAELEKAERSRYQKRIHVLDEARRIERERRATELAAAREACKANAIRAREEAAAAFEEAEQARKEKRRDAAAADRRARALALDARAARAQSERELCALSKQSIRVERAAALAHVKDQRKEEVRFRKELLRLERRGTAKEKPQSTARERAAESDDEVRRNIPPEFVRLFNAIKKSIKATDRKSRTEAFLQYVEENPSEVWTVSEEGIAAEMLALEATRGRPTKRVPKRPKSKVEDKIPF